MGSGIARSTGIVLCSFSRSTVRTVCAMSGSRTLSGMAEEIPGAYGKQDQKGERKQYLGATGCDVFRIVVA